MAAREQSVGRHPMIFTSHGQPLKFFLLGTEDELAISWNQTPLSSAHVKSLTQKIQRYGGEVLDGRDRDKADTVIVNEEAVEEYRHYYWLNRSIYVEPPGFISKCISSGRYHHQLPAQKGMGGRQAGSTRNNFTPEDEHHMCKFVALTIPDPSAGGRLGPGLWKWLIEEYSERPEYAWAKRHTPQSWQEHYKKNREHLDEMVDKIVAKNPPPLDGKCLYLLSRNRTRRNIRLEQIEEREEEDAVVELVTPRKRRRIDHSTDSRVSTRNTLRESSTTHTSPFRQQFGTPPSFFPTEQDDRSVRHPSMSERQEEEELSHEEGEIAWPEHIFEPVAGTPDIVRPGPSDAEPSGMMRSATLTNRRQQQDTQVSGSARRPRRESFDSSFPMSSQATLVAPNPTQLQKRGTEPSQAPPSRREVITVESSPEGGKRMSSSRVAAQRPENASTNKRTSQTLVPEVVPSVRNFAASGRLLIGTVTGDRAESPDSEVGIVQQVIVEDDDEAPETGGDEDLAEGALSTPDEDEIEITGGIASGAERTAEYERLYPNLEEAELLSSDDERIHQSLLNSSRRSPEARRRFPGAFSSSPLNEAEHHDFSASEADDEDEDEDAAPESPRRLLFQPMAPATPARGQTSRSVPVSAEHTGVPLYVRARSAGQTRSEGRQANVARALPSSPLPSPPVTRTYLSRATARRDRALT